MAIRGMRYADIDFAHDCTVSEGWLSETREVFRAFLEYDPGGCFIAEHACRNIGVCVATGYNTNGFIGELIVMKEMRGRGYGRRLFSRAFQYLQSKGIQNIFLDGDLGAVSLYERSGFRKVCRSLRFVGTARARVCGGVRQMRPGDVEAVCGLDGKFFGDDRSFFLKRRFVASPNLFYTAETGSAVCGYIAAQPGNGVVTVGPWAATDELDEPGVLLERLSSVVGSTPMRIGVLETNRKAVDLIRQIGTLREQDHCWRMVYGPSDRLGMSDNLFAIGSPAKG